LRNEADRTLGHPIALARSSSRRPLCQSRSVAPSGAGSRPRPFIEPLENVPTPASGISLQAHRGRRPSIDCWGTTRPMERVVRDAFSVRGIAGRSNSPFKRKQGIWLQGIEAIAIFDGYPPEFNLYFEIRATPPPACPVPIAKHRDRPEDLDDFHGAKLQNCGRGGDVTGGLGGPNQSRRQRSKIGVMARVFLFTVSSKPDPRRAAIGEFNSDSLQSASQRHQSRSVSNQDPPACFKPLDGCQGHR
jgi:hypothetical protein